MTRLTQVTAATLITLWALVAGAQTDNPEAPPKTDTPLQDAPEQFRNIYEASYFGFTITVTHELTPTDDGHKLRFFADSWLASLEEISHFDWDEKGRLRPQHYTYKRRGLGRDRTAILDFDWEAGTVTNNVEDKPWTMDIHPGIQDKVSFQVQLQRDLIAGNTEDLVYEIADGGHIKEYTFAIVARETLDTPLGKVDTVKVERTRKDDDRVTYAWMAPKFGYLLVRMQQLEDGDSYTIYIHEAEIDGQKIDSFE